MKITLYRNIDKDYPWNIYFSFFMFHQLLTICIMKCKEEVLEFAQYLSDDQEKLFEYNQYV